MKDETYETFAAYHAAIFTPFIMLILVPIVSLLTAVPLWLAWNYGMTELGLPHLSYLKTYAILIVLKFTMPPSWFPLRLRKAE